MLRLGYDAKRIFHNATGLGNYGRDLLRILREQYPENRYYLYNPKAPRLRRFQLTDNTVERRPQGFPWKYLPSLWRSLGMTKDLQTDRIDVYHGLSAELPAGIASTGIPSVVTVHDLIFLRYPELYKAPDRWIYRRKFLHAVSRADTVVAISEQTRQDILQYARIGEDKIRVIYQGCHPVFKEEPPAALADKLRDKYHLPDTFLLQVGTVEPRKNLGTVIRALRDLPYHLVVVGRLTAYGRQWQAEIEKWGMNRRIIFLQGLEPQELAALYRMARVSVYPSVFEGFGIPIIESLFQSTPVITNAQGVFPEAAGPGGIYLNDVTDAGEMKEKIRYAMENDLSGMARQGKDYVQKHFSDRVIGRQWMDLYERLAGKSTQKSF